MIDTQAVGAGIQGHMTALGHEPHNCQDSGAKRAVRQANQVGDNPSEHPGETRAFRGHPQCECTRAATC